MPGLGLPPGGGNFKGLAWDSIVGALRQACVVESVMRLLVAGNWKMNGLGVDLAELVALKAALGESPACDVLVCPPATLIAQAAAQAGASFSVGAQDCHPRASGAFTGDISAEMLKDAGATAVIVGHSERRQFHGETDADVAGKAAAAWRAGLLAIVCIGETGAQRDAGTANHVCGSQLEASLPDGATGTNTAIAYEPVWAIGTGRTPSEGDIAAMHAHIRACLARRFGEKGSAVRILYGGSVKPDNAARILGLPEVDGALVGGASLKAKSFAAIIHAAG
jgi:triosephosphate isomerase